MRFQFTFIRTEKGLHSGVMPTKSGFCSSKTCQNRCLSEGFVKSQPLVRSKLGGMVVECMLRSYKNWVSLGGENSSHTFQFVEGAMAAAKE